MTKLGLTVAVALVAALGTIVWGISSARGGQPEPKAVKKAAQKAAEISKAMRGTTYSMSDAIKEAEKATGGKSIACMVEFENGGAVIEVTILKDGDAPKLLEAEIDGKTNKVLEVEDADDEDDDEDDDDGADDDGDDTDEGEGVGKPAGARK
ncbi:MAG: PepSY domain-containing protein [Planctomycetes bacterium]|nr:PepSY domain-containing protein [Planctomycetota bacterium]